MRTEYAIVVDTEIDLTRAQQLELLENMRWRLHGYVTTCPEFMKNSTCQIVLEAEQQSDV